MRGRDFKDAVFAQLARIGGSFASPKRIEIIDVLAQGERSVETLARETALTVANTSRHLQVLKGANLVTSRKQGVQSYYRLADPLVLTGYKDLQALAEARLAEVGRLVEDFFAGVDGLEPVETDELLRRVNEEDVTVLDVRPSEEFASGHIAGAVSIPLGDLERRLAELPHGRRIVAYCRGPYCVLAAEAVRLLRGRGFEAARLMDGFPQWRHAGLPVAAGAAAAPRRTKEQRQ